VQLPHHEKHADLRTPKSTPGPRCRSSGKRPPEYHVRGESPQVNGGSAGVSRCSGAGCFSCAIEPHQCAARPILRMTFTSYTTCDDSEFCAFFDVDLSCPGLEYSWSGRPTWSTWDWVRSSRSGDISSMSIGTCACGDGNGGNPERSCRVVLQRFVIPSRGGPRPPLYNLRRRPCLMACTRAMTLSTRRRSR
jgi:hypothetical protein